MPVRLQMLRHLDAAYEIAGPRTLLGFFMVEGAEDGALPDVWREACGQTLDPEMLEMSLPHRSPEERGRIAEAFLGAVTWQRGCDALGVPRDTPIDDRTPPPDLARILKIVERNRRDFGDYLAVVGGDNRDRRFAVHLIRCKGDKCRVDIGLGDTRHGALVVVLVVGPAKQHLLAATPTGDHSNADLDQSHVGFGMRLNRVAVQ